MRLVPTEHQAAWLQALSASEDGDSALVEKRFMTLAGLTIMKKY